MDLGEKSFLDQFLILYTIEVQKNTNLMSGQFCKGRSITQATYGFFQNDIPSLKIV